MRWSPGALLLLSSVALAGEIQGQVLSSGPSPARGNLEVLRDRKFCGESQPDESLLIGPGGGLQNAVAYLEDAPKVAPAQPAGTATLDQRDCRYVPHVLAAHVGTTLDVVNSDPILHNVNAVAGTRTAFNLAFPLRGQKRPQVLSDAGVLRATCNAGHTWMTAWIHVFAHPFFGVSRADGSFSIAGVPPGRYTLAVWHEKLGLQKVEVTVPAEGVARTSVDFRRP
jgi:hypothetical protein